ncbi:hypothetical protein PIB30_015858 [Stylosanthes scabra]|uniref:Uncharacterized protein n=1 Tax=Stylosanthes scabra TaxID=79078 RepID=A0ABU6S725_9FABA|nr:hypothetical protein [Stylosanthes scabra]
MEGGNRAEEAARPSSSSSSLGTNQQMSHHPNEEEETEEEKEEDEQDHETDHIKNTTFEPGHVLSLKDQIKAQQGIDTEAPSQLQNLCNLTFIFEVRVNDYNLKEGSQNYTVIKTFVPTKVTEEQPILHKIKQEPKSLEIASSEEDDMPINRFKRKNCNQNQVAQSEEEISINQGKKSQHNKGTHQLLHTNRLST